MLNALRDLLVSSLGDQKMVRFRQHMFHCKVPSFHKYFDTFNHVRARNFFKSCHLFSSYVMTFSDLPLNFEVFFKPKAIFTE